MTSRRTSRCSSGSSRPDAGRPAPAPADAGRRGDAKAVAEFLDGKAGGAGHGRGEYSRRAVFSAWGRQSARPPRPGIQYSES